MMRKIVLLQPQRLVFGRDCAGDCAPHLRRAGLKRAFLVTGPPTRRLAELLAETLRQAGLQAEIFDGVDREPTIAMFRVALDTARAAQPNVVIGIGGGSSLDVAKLVAALLDGKQTVEQSFGIDLLAGRSTFLACLPTTAGTGSEVSPNAILLDESEHLKKAVVSPHLVPDATFVDPVLTVSMPPAVTAGTGLDALTHCIEAYTNRFSHPAIDLYALEGIRLIAANLPRAVADGRDLDAREKLALGSMYGGLCLGPVNTAAVHALAYPLGGEFHVAHGISNAVLLPYVMEFNLRACPERYADVALALGAEPRSDAAETARQGVQRVHKIARQCGVPMNLADLKVPRSAVSRMAEAAMRVERLLKNNPRELTIADATRVYEQAFQPQG
jgi:alcohol dehydrogenase class IV